jgi:hypothetical protein
MKIILVIVGIVVMSFIAIQSVNAQIISIPSNMHICISLIIRTHDLATAFNSSENTVFATNQTIAEVEKCILHPERFSK